MAVALFLFLYSNDNKYAVSQPRAVGGLLTLDGDMLDTYPVLFLISGWEFYNGALLSPQDFKSSVPCEYVYIGQYGNFAAGNKNAPPHGSATYRLNIIVPEQPREYMLELPEIFSAYRAYINGKEVMQMGDPDPAAYRADTGNRTVTFTAGGNIEIIIAVSDFSYLYSGMTYPPMFGEPEQVVGMLDARLGIRIAVCAIALAVALLSMLIGLLARSGKLPLLYGLLSVCFIGYVAYPILNTFTMGFQPFYAIENIAFCVVLLLAMNIQYKTCGQNDRFSRYFMCLGLFCCAVAAAFHSTAFLHSVVVMAGFSWLISAYEIIAAGYLTFMAIRAIVRKTTPSLTLLAGILIFDCALVMDRLLPLYEPIRTGWFIEIATFALVIAIGAVIAQEVAAKYRDNAVLTERAYSMERLSDMQQGYFAVLRQEMDETKAARHDIHHHFAVMKGYLQNNQYDELARYIAEYPAPAHTELTEVYSENNVINILIHHYGILCEQNRIFLDTRCVLTEPVRVTDADLCGVLSNLLENAVEACLRIQTGRRAIRLGLTNMGDVLSIHIENSTDGGVKQNGLTFLSSKGEDRVGYGLASIHSIAKRYNGTVSFTWDREKRLFTSIVVL
ncbi:MAG: GHKL domain-containing protein [Oscillospiraceae bacterium]|nr:GHKL domain-containing protein [Oscillospiraceae bacterium]